ncbi:hypothetical protein GYA13_00680 [Candidatus Kuenenbacteria bacterium]|nr:hypothetical protein [Candidatus Kuenenbacteria bacterium]
MPCGPCSPPKRGQAGETKFGFTVDQRVMVIEKGDCFYGWHGHVRTFDNTLVAVDLDEPPPGCESNGQWFRPNKLQAA